MTQTHFLESTISLEESKVSIFIRPYFSETRLKPWVGFTASSFSAFLLSSVLVIARLIFFLSHLWSSF